MSDLLAAARTQAKVLDDTRAASARERFASTITKHEATLAAALTEVFGPAASELVTEVSSLRVLGSPASFDLSSKVLEAPGVQVAAIMFSVRKQGSSTIGAQVFTAPSNYSLRRHDNLVTSSYSDDLSATLEATLDGCPRGTHLRREVEVLGSVALDRLDFAFAVEHAARLDARRSRPGLLNRLKAWFTRGRA